MQFQIHRSKSTLILLILFLTFSTLTLSVDAAPPSKEESKEMSAFIQEQFSSLPMLIHELEDISLYLADRIEKVQAEATSKDWEIRRLVGEINDKTNEVISVQITKGSPVLIDRKKEALRNLRDKIVEKLEEDSGGDRDKFLLFLNNNVKHELYRQSKGRTSTDSIITQEDVRHRLMDLNDENIAVTTSRFASGLEKLLKEAEENPNWDTATILSKVTTRSNRAIETLDETIKTEWSDATTNLIADINNDSSLTRTELIRLLRDEVLPALENPSLENTVSNSVETEFGFKKYVVEQAENYPPLLDFYRFNTALDIANFYDEHAGDFKNSTDPNQVAIELNKQVHELAAQKSRPSAEADDHPWKALLQFLRIKRNSLHREGRFDAQNPTQWKIIYHELAAGFKELSKQYHKSRDLTEEQRRLLNAMDTTTTIPSSGSTFQSDQYLDAHSLKRALRYRRKKLHFERKLQRLPQR